MSDYGWGMFKKGLKRRKKEVRRMRVMTCLAVFFLVFTILLQDNLNSFQKELNDRKYGSWAVRATDASLDGNAELELGGTAKVGSYAYLTHPKYDDINDLAPIKTSGANGSFSLEQPPIRDDTGNWLPPQETILVTELGGWRNTMGLIGAFSEDFMSNNSFEFHEGRFPEKDNEIVMERDLLLKLGYGYDLGQEIMLYTALPFTDPRMDPNYTGIPESIPDEAFYITLKLQKYVLVGTIEKYTNVWDGASYTLPNAIISEAAYDDLEMNKTEYRFYGFSSGISRDKIWDTAEELFGRLESENSGSSDLWFNKSNYTSPFMGSKTVYSGITILLMVMSASILAYLMSVYLGKRRLFYLRMREIGATTTEVWRLSAFECLSAVTPPALLMFAASIAFSFVLSLLLSWISKVDIFFVLRPRSFIFALLIICTVIAVSLFAALLIFTGRGLNEKKKPMGKLSAKALRKRAARKRKKTYLGFEEILVRGRRIGSIKTTLLRTLSILVCALILFCAVRVGSPLISWLKTNAMVSISGQRELDYAQIECRADVKPQWDDSYDSPKRITEKTVNVSVAGPIHSMNDVVGKDALNELGELSGIKTVYANTYDAFYHLDWQGRENDIFMNACIEKAIHWPELEKQNELVYDGPNLEGLEKCMGDSFFRLFCMGDTDTIWRKAKKYLCREANKDAFLRGEQIILLVDGNADYIIENCASETDPENVQGTVNGEFFSTLDLSIRAGDAAEIIRTNGKESEGLPVTVAAVIPMDKFDLAPGMLYDDEVEQVLFSIIGSPGLAERIMTSEGREYGANMIGIKLDQYGAKDNQVKSIVSFFVRNGITDNIIDNTERAVRARRSFYQALSTFGVMLFTILVLFMFVRKTVSDEENMQNCKRLKLLLGSGIAEKSLKHQKSIDSAKQTLWLFPALPISFIISLIYYEAKRFSMIGDSAGKNELVKTILSDPINELRDMLLSRGYQFETAILLFALIMLMVWLIDRRLVFESDKPERIE